MSETELYPSPWLLPVELSFAQGQRGDWGVRLREELSGLEALETNQCLE